MCMRRPCPEGKAHEGWAAPSGVRTVKHPDSATSPRILCMVWASTSPQWKVTASLAQVQGFTHTRDAKSRLLHFVLCRRERSVFSEPHSWRRSWESRSAQRRSLGVDGRSSGVGSHARRTQPHGAAIVPAMLLFTLCLVSQWGRIKWQQQCHWQIEMRNICEIHFKRSEQWLLFVCLLCSM